MRAIIPLFLLAALTTPNAWAQSHETEMRTQMKACVDAFAQVPANASAVYRKTFEALRDTQRPVTCRFLPSIAASAKPEEAKPYVAAVLAILDADRKTRKCETTASIACSMIADVTALAKKMTRTGADTPAPVATDLDYDGDAITWGIGPQAISFPRLVLRRGAPAEAAKFAANADVNGVTVSAAACAACLEDARESLPYVVLLDGLAIADGIASQGPAWGRLAEIAERNDARWQAYHFGGGQARTPLPWELLVNGLIYNAVDPRKEGDIVGSLPEAPEWALTLLHPSVGVAPFDSHGADSNLVGVVELLGVSHWSYNDETNARENEWGLSAASVYQPRDDGRDWNFGVLLRTPLNGLNVVWSKVDMKVGDDVDMVAFSIDPGKLFEAVGGGGSIECMFGLKTCKKS